MGQALSSEYVSRFPVINFRKKRLTVAIHAHFDLESARDVAEVKQKIETALEQIARDGQTKVSFSLSDV